MKAILFALHILVTCRHNDTSLVENIVLLALAAELNTSYDIANKIGLAASNIVTCLHRLAKAGYIESYDWAGDSIPCYRLTTKGTEHVMQFFPTPSNSNRKS